MSEENKAGISKTGAGLSLLTCLLAALGYFVLQRLVDSSDSSSVVGTSTTPNTTYQSPVTGSPNPDTDPQIQPVQGSEPSPVSYPQTSLLPILVAPQPDSDDTRLQRFDPSAPVEDVHEPSLFESQQIGDRQDSDEPTRY